MIHRVHEFGTDAIRANEAKGNAEFNIGRLLEAARDTLGFVAIEHVILVFQPNGGWGGNHKHLRQELTIPVEGSEGLVVTYLDEAGVRVDEPMIAGAAYMMPSWEPHMIVNHGDRPAMLLEVRDRISDEFAALEGAESFRQDS